MNSANLKRLSQKLYTLFIVNKTRYAKQLSSGQYNTVYRPITPFKIQRILEEKGSILTYQELNGFVKWICLDFDIKKEFHEEYKVGNHFSELIRQVKKATLLLDFKKINYILEFSGGRGFHIWIIFKAPIRKYQGYAVVNNLKNKLMPLHHTINIDLYPKTAEVNPKSKGIGLGVKLPLSYHQKSQKYSYLINNIDESSDYLHLRQLDDLMLEKQFIIIDNYIPQDFSDLINKLDIDLNNNSDHKKFLQLNSVNLKLQLSLEKIIEKLNSCSCLRKILERYQLHLNNQERHILVGLLGRLKHKEDQEYGKNLLQNIFSNLPGYDPVLTQNMLDLLKYYYPPTCHYLREYIGQHCTCSCNKDNIRSPIELLLEDGSIEAIRFSEPFAIDRFLYKNIFNAQLKYSYYNDEVPLAINKAYLCDKAYPFEYINIEYENILNDRYEIINPAIAFQRREAADKIRNLHVLDAKYKILSSIGLYHLYVLWDKYISPNSYGYRVNMSFSNGRIFESWLTLWRDYTGKIKDIINDKDGDFDNYYILKLDLKGFYDTIDLERLKIKLTTEAISEEVRDLQDLDRGKYNNLVKFLCELCSNIVKSPKGVPQGPAFARYLAEIYLLGLDDKINEFLEEGYEFFYRYVDDFFIFIKTRERANELDLLISSWLSINSLERNNSKSLIISVRSFKEQGLLNTYLDETKYFVDQVSKHKAIATDSDIKTAIAHANELLSVSSFGLKDHFRFIFSHDFEDAEFINAKKRIENMIIESATGRGDMYKLFFDKYYLRNEIRAISLAQVKKMNSLALENYLNSLSEIEYEFSQKHKDYVAELIRSNLKFSNSMKSNLIRIIWKHNIDVHMNLGTGDYEIIKKIIESPEKYSLSEAQLAFLDINSYFNEDDINIFIHKIYLFIYNNYISLNYISKLAQHFWKRFSEFITNEKKVNRLKVNGPCLYNLLCLFSITNDDTSHTVCWKYYLEELSNIDTNSTESDYKSNWFECIQNKFDNISPNMIIACLSMNKDGTTLGCVNDVFNLITKFKEILAVVLTYNRALKTPEMNTALDELKKRDKFLKWIFDDTVQLYPTDGELCLLNIAYNNLVVMKKQDKFLIKILTSDFPCNFTLDSDSKTAELTKTNEIELGEYISSNNIYIVFKRIVELYKCSQKFAKQNSCDYPNYFMNPTYLKINGEEIEPFLTFYACGEKLVPQKPHRIVNNNEDGFCILRIPMNLDSDS